VVMWFTELMSFFLIMLFPTVFIGGTATNITQFFSSGRSIPMSYVLTLLTQFLLIVADRVIYLFRAVRVKVIFQYLQVFFLHFWLWFFLPSQNGDYFARFPSLIVFYLLKFVYLTVSGLQIAYGYPQFVQGQFLTDSKSPSQLRYYTFVAYRAIPFVYELRTLLDWTITKTTLSFYEWLKLEDVYAQLFLVKCRVTSDKHWERNVGDKTPWYMYASTSSLCVAIFPHKFCCLLGKCLLVFSCSER
jgi:piezo-type mechanosensitive ion channel component 1/2